MSKVDQVDLPQPPSYDHLGSSPPQYQHQYQQHQQQQEPQQPPVVVVHGEPKPLVDCDALCGACSRQEPNGIDFLPAVILSCVAFWLCGCIFGFIGLILAVFGYGAAKDGNNQKAKTLWRASFGVSAAGVIIFVIAGVVLLTLWIVETRRRIDENYRELEYLNKFTRAPYLWRQTKVPIYPSY